MILTLHLMLLCLGILGVGLSLYMNRVMSQVLHGREVRCFDDVCPLVMKTPYAQSFGFPNTYLAVPFYAAIVIIAALRLAGRGAWLVAPAAVASALSVLMSIYLAYALLVRLKAT